MRRRRVVVGLVVAAATIAVLWPRPSHPCLATFERVREGMTYDEVCVTVGGPPGDYAAPDEWHPPWPMWGAGWHSGDGHLRVHFDRDGRADWVSVARLGPPSVWSRLRGWLGL